MNTRRLFQVKQIMNTRRTKLDKVKHNFRDHGTNHNYSGNKNFKLCETKCSSNRRNKQLLVELYNVYIFMVDISK